ncbi:MAG: hypothetical protein KIT70_08400 [Anaerolineales bacterium]|nr:MAG: hypothetical protein KIT70_08400 [Anaerolineales bacterium]
MLISLSVFVALLAACSTPTATPEPTVQAKQTSEQSTATVENPTQEPTAKPTATLAPAERNYEWTDGEAVTVRADFTEEELAEKLEGLHIFPLVNSEHIGIYQQRCILENISFLKEHAYIRIGNFGITVTGQCTYLDINRERQTITVALVVHNIAEKTTWIPPDRVMPGIVRSDPHLIQEIFAEDTDAAGGEITAGSEIFVLFSLRNPSNQRNFMGAEHHGALVDEIYTEEMIQGYVTTGNPEVFESLLLVPLSVMKSQ